MDPHTVDPPNSMFYIHVRKKPIFSEKNAGEQKNQIPGAVSLGQVKTDSTEGALSRGRAKW